MSRSEPKTIVQAAATRLFAKLEDTLADFDTALTGLCTLGSEKSLLEQHGDAAVDAFVHAVALTRDVSESLDNTRLVVHKLIAALQTAGIGVKTPCSTPATLDLELESTVSSTSTNTRGIQRSTRALFESDEHFLDLFRLVVLWAILYNKDLSGLPFNRLVADSDDGQHGDDSGAGVYP